MLTKGIAEAPNTTANYGLPPKQDFASPTSSYAASNTDISLANPVTDESQEQEPAGHAVEVEIEPASPPRRKMAYMDDDFDDQALIKKAEALRKEVEEKKAAEEEKKTAAEGKNLNITCTGHPCRLEHELTTCLFSSTFYQQPPKPSLHGSGGSKSLLLPMAQ